VTREIFITAALAALTLVAFAGWWLMTRRTEQWALWVDRENNFWRNKGLLSPGLAEKLKRWETGRAFKTLAAVTTLIGLIGVALTITVLIKGLSLQHQKLRMPYNPALQVRPSRPPSPKPH
jgi:hypothetical protein